MKVRDKKTGKEFFISIVCVGEEGVGGCESISELVEKYEDVKETDKYYIDYDGQVLPYSDLDCESSTYFHMKAIGNSFTKEEAELAVRKLEAWKRLKDKGFRFDLSPALGHCDDKKFDISIIGTMPAKWWYNDKVVDDIHYIFGGEE